MNRHLAPLSPALGAALLGLSLLTPACDRRDELEPAEALEADTHPTEEGAEVQAPVRPRPHEPPAPPSPPSGSDLAKHHGMLAKHQAPPVVPDAKRAFEELTTLVESKYVDGPLSEDALWSAAMEGVLARLVQLPGHEINTLLAPREHEELLIGTSGRLVGVGIMIERVADVVVVRGVVPGGPAERAGLQAGDRILGIDGARTKDLDLTTVVDRIRGEDGTKVDLFVQRDTEEWTETITRGLVEVPSVQARTLRDGVGYLRITSFSKETPRELDAHLRALAAEGTQRLVLDLRQCPGGLLDTALETIDRFVAPGRTVLTVRGRDTEPRTETTEGDHPSQTWSLAVLVGPKTASGAEILADAIATHDRGVLIGETTLGKHTIESIHELSGGWAVKLSVHRFATASGQDEQGVGVTPDIRIPSDPETKLASIEEIDPSVDPPLAAAVELLRAE